MTASSISMAEMDIPLQDRAGTAAPLNLALEGILVALAVCLLPFPKKELDLEVVELLLVVLTMRKRARIFMVSVDQHTAISFWFRYWGDLVVVAAVVVHGSRDRGAAPAAGPC